jgi:hypothetical protein
MNSFGYKSLTNSPTTLAERKERITAFYQMVVFKKRKLCGDDILFAHSLATTKKVKNLRRLLTIL